MLVLFIIFVLIVFFRLLVNGVRFFKSKDLKQQIHYSEMLKLYSLIGSSCILFSSILMSICYFTNCSRIVQIISYILEANMIGLAILCILVEYAQEDPNNQQ